MPATLTRRHSYAFLGMVMRLQTEYIAMGLPVQTRMRLLCHLASVFRLHVNSDEITAKAIASITGLNRRTVNMGFTELSAAGIVRHTIIRASHGKSRAYLYSFTDDFSSRSIARTRRSSPPQTKPAAYFFFAAGGAPACC